MTRLAIVFSLAACVGDNAVPTVELDAGVDALALDCGAAPTVPNPEREWLCNEAGCKVQLTEQAWQSVTAYQALASSWIACAQEGV